MTGSERGIRGDDEWGEVPSMNSNAWGAAGRSEVDGQATMMKVGKALYSMAHGAG